MKDLTERIDEILGIVMAGVKAGRKAGGSGGGRKLPKGARFGKLDDLYLEVLYHKTLNGMEAAEDIIKKKNLDRKTAKALRKKVKQR
jgi:hypothetical protein